MSGGVTAAQVAAAASLAGAVGGTFMAYKNGQDQKAAAEDAAAEAKRNAEKQAKAAEEANNKANQKKADTSAILSAAQQAGKGGLSGTMLTGPQGISPTALNLGKNTLLGS